MNRDGDVNTLVKLMENNLEKFRDKPSFDINRIPIHLRNNPYYNTPLEEVNIPQPSTPIIPPGEKFTMKDFEIFDTLK